MSGKKRESASDRFKAAIGQARREGIEEFAVAIRRKMNVDPRIRDTRSPTTVRAEIARFIREFAESEGIDTKDIFWTDAPS
jgi:hypothetical protein